MAVLAIAELPYPGTIEAWKVNADVGNVKNNRPELMERWGYSGGPVASA